MIAPGRYWRTLRHLKPEQTFGRLLYRMRRVRPDPRPAPPLRALRAGWIEPARRAASITAQRSWLFLGEERGLDIDFDDPSIEKLWRYNQHYFDDLNAFGAGQRRDLHRELLARWIAGNPMGTGTAWEPYPTSLRIVNWIKWFAAGEPPAAEWVQSLAVQTRWLSQRLEKHLLGNHLFVNAKALVFAGSFFTGPESDRWLAAGLDLLRREIPLQILADGGQFELSPMYHALALEDLLDLVNLSRVSGCAASDAQAWRESAASMLGWLRNLSLPDGTLAHFNDSAAGVAPPIAELERLAAALGVSAAYPAEGTTHLPQSGYLRLARGAAVALIDVAAVGPDYLPAHAHADSLSFELSLGGRNLLVNGGTSCYGNSSQRQRERSTAAHNTVEVAGADSSEVWGAFRVGRRARIRALEILDDRVCAAHDGYRFLPGRPIHRRCWTLDDSGLSVEDRVQPALQPAIARFLLAPGLTLVRADARNWQIVEAGNCLARAEIFAGNAHVERGIHAPRFGEQIEVDCLAVALVEGAASCRFNWK